MKPHPYLAIVPELSQPEFDALLADVKQHGQIYPITLCNGQIIDGRARWRACTMLDIRPRMEEVDLTDMQALDFVISANVRRRHLTKSQIAVILGLPYMREKAKIVAGEKAEKNRVEKLNRGKVAAVDAATYNYEGRSETAKQAAEKLGIGAKTLEDAKTVEKKAPDLIPPIARGEMSVEAAVKSIRQPKPPAPEPKPDAAEYVIDRSKALIASIRRDLKSAAESIHKLHEEYKMRQMGMPEELFNELIGASGSVITINNYFQEFKKFPGAKFVGPREVLDADWQEVA